MVVRLQWYRGFPATVPSGHLLCVRPQCHSRALRLPAAGPWRDHGTILDNVLPRCPRGWPTTDKLRLSRNGEQSGPVGMLYSALFSHWAECDATYRMSGAWGAEGAGQ